MRRSHFPIRYTEGFNPRPRMSFASALTLGATSEAELCQVDLEGDLDADTVRTAMGALRAQLPNGLSIGEVWAVPLERRNPYIQINAAGYDLKWSGPQAGSRLRTVLAAGALPPGAETLSVEELGPEEVLLRIRLPAGERGGTRIRDLAAALEKELAADNSSPLRMTRLHRHGLWCEAEPQDRLE